MSERSRLNSSKVKPGQPSRAQRQATHLGRTARDRGRESSGRHSQGPRTLAIDIGGSGLKASVLNEASEMLTDRVRVDTPVGEPPETTVDTIAELAASLPAFDRVSVAFPGAVRTGKVLRAPNLKHHGWHGFDLASALTHRLKTPVRVVNDAEMQARAVIDGKGIEMVITLGTGLGTALYLDGQYGPYLNLGEQPFRKGETYDEQLGNSARKRVGNKKWNERVREAIKNLRVLIGFDHLYIGGGNARKIRFTLDPDTTIISNDSGIRGGIALWRNGGAAGGPRVTRRTFNTPRTLRNSV